jgi:hypothetical protein
MNRSTIGISVLTLLLAAPSLAAHAQAAKPVTAPDLRAGGAKPSTIPNHETTEVTLPGHHLAGTTVTVTGVCTLKSYKVVSDAEIVMQIEGNRPIDSKEDGCFLKVSLGAKHADTYVVVALTEAEESQKNSDEAARDKVKAQAYMSNLGTQWILHYADGVSETFTAQPADPGQLPDYSSTSGTTAKIMISDGTNVTIMADGCILSGTLTGSQVKNGKVYAGTCKHPGAWTAQKK